MRQLAPHVTNMAVSSVAMAGLTGRLDRWEIGQLSTMTNLMLHFAGQALDPIDLGASALSSLQQLDIMSQVNWSNKRGARMSLVADTSAITNLTKLDLHDVAVPSATLAPLPCLACLYVTNGSFEASSHAFLTALTCFEMRGLSVGGDASFFGCLNSLQQLHCESIDHLHLTADYHAQDSSASFFQAFSTALGALTQLSSLVLVRLPLITLTSNCVSSLTKMQQLQYVPSFGEGVQGMAAPFALPPTLTALKSLKLANMPLLHVDTWPWPPQLSVLGLHNNMLPSFPRFEGYGVGGPRLCSLACISLEALPATFQLAGPLNVNAVATHSLIILKRASGHKWSEDSLAWMDASWQQVDFAAIHYDSEHATGATPMYQALYRQKPVTLIIIAGGI